MSTSDKAGESPVTVSLADEDAVRRIVSGAVFDLWRIVNDLTRLRPSARERYRVAIFGSARAEPGTPVYDEVKRVAAAIAAMDCDVVTGGGPGLMQAANEAGRRASAVRTRWASGSNRSFEQSARTRTSSTRSSIKRSSHGCIISSSLRTRSSSCPAVSAPCWKCS
jgi:hypothetical protein